MAWEAAPVAATTCSCRSKHRPTQQSSLLVPAIECRLMKYVPSSSMLEVTEHHPVHNPFRSDQQTYRPVSPPFREPRGFCGSEMCPMQPGFGSQYVLGIR